MTSWRLEVTNEAPSRTTQVRVTQQPRESSFVLAFTHCITFSYKLIISLPCMLLCGDRTCQNQEAELSASKLSRYLRVLHSLWKRRIWIEYSKTKQCNTRPLQTGTLHHTRTCHSGQAKLQNITSRHVMSCHCTSDTSRYVTAHVSSSNVTSLQLHHILITSTCDQTSQHIMSDIKTHT